MLIKAASIYYHDSDGPIVGEVYCMQINCVSYICLEPGCKLKWTLYNYHAWWPHITVAGQRIPALVSWKCKMTNHASCPLHECGAFNMLNSPREARTGQDTPVCCSRMPILQEILTDHRKPTESPQTMPPLPRQHWKAHLDVHDIPPHPYHNDITQFLHGWSNTTSTQSTTLTAGQKGNLQYVALGCVVTRAHDNIACALMEHSYSCIKCWYTCRPCALEH